MVFSDVLALFMCMDLELCSFWVDVNSRMSNLGGESLLEPLGIR